jgi:tryptophan 7-halogenase
VGQGLIPRTYDPVANLISEEETKVRLDQIRGAVLNSADYMPRHTDFIRDNCAA